eukprot:6548024-Pyramimonas_sp.AAC.1
MSALNVTASAATFACAISARSSSARSHAPTLAQAAASEANVRLLGVRPIVVRISSKRASASGRRDPLAHAEMVAE